MNWTKPLKPLSPRIKGRTIVVMASAKRDFDVLIWGSTGFTGSLVARHAAAEYSNSPLRFGLHGRSEVKLKQLRDTLVQEYPAFAERIELVVADNNNQAAVDAAVSRAQVVISSAGPFARYGTPVVDAAVRASTHYADLTAEMPWVRGLIDTYHETAVKKRVKIVPMSGYDSTPSDLGVLFAATEMTKKYPGIKLDTVSNGIGDTRGGFSGGTIESGFNLVQQFSAEELRRVGNPFYLCPQSAAPAAIAHPTSHGDVVLPVWDKGLQSYLAPFVMAPINSRVVRRSQALLGYPFGDALKYTEGFKTGSLLVGGLVSALNAGMGAIMSVKPLQPLIRGRLPMPGTGPSRELQVGGYWNVHLAATGRDPKTGREVTGFFRVSDRNRDAGYWSTSRMLLESGICMATQGEECERRGGLPGGLLTPASSGGQVLIERLKNAGIEFVVEKI